MFKHWQALTSFALFPLLVCAEQKTSQEKNLEPVLTVVQTDASRPGDESLNCEGLEKELLTSMNDPAVQSHLSRGAAKQQPTAIMLTRTTQLATRNLRQEVKQMNELLTIAPQLMRGQRVMQLARARNCEWLQATPEFSTGHEAGH